MNKTDYDITRDIINTFNSLKINDIVEILHDRPSEDDPAEFIPLFDGARTCLEKLLRVSVALGGWLNEKNINIRSKADERLSTEILNALNSIEIKYIESLSLSEQEDLDMMLSFISNLLHIQYNLFKWLLHLHEKYNAGITEAINFIYK